MKSDIKVITGIKDWSSDSDKKIPKNAYAPFTLDGVTSYNMGLYKDSGSHFRTSGYVGVGWIKDYYGNICRDKDGQKTAIMIQPRFDLNPWEMLVTVMGDAEYDKYISAKDDFFEIHPEEPFIPVEGGGIGGVFLAMLSFLKECERACRKRVKRDMSFHESNLNGHVIGNIQVAKHIKYNLTQAREDRIYCRYPVFTVDTIENRIMKCTLKKVRKELRSKRFSNEVMNRLLNYCEASLKDVKDIKISRSDFNRISVTGFNSYYKKAMDLAKIVLYSGNSNDLTENDGAEQSYVMPYTINMETLFEFYVRTMLKKTLAKHPDYHLRLDEYRTPKENPLKTIKNGSDEAYLMPSYIPDIALIDTSDSQERYVAVYDVKYQRSTRAYFKNTRRHNTHQLLFYTLLLNVKECGFIFPTDRKEGVANDEGKGYELNIVEGDAMDESRREYSQWEVRTEKDDKAGFAKRMLEYVKRSEE